MARAFWAASTNRVRQDVTAGKDLVAVFVFGLLMGFLPCRLSYAAFARALASGRLTEGCLMLICFGLGNVPGLFAVGITLTTRPRSSTAPRMERQSRNWARLIQKVYEVSPLVRPRCKKEMRFIARNRKPRGDPQDHPTSCGFFSLTHNSATCCFPAI
jgi:hypothetical protein